MSTTKLAAEIDAWITEQESPRRHKPTEPNGTAYRKKPLVETGFGETSSDRVLEGEGEREEKPYRSSPFKYHRRDPLTLKQPLSAQAPAAPAPAPKAPELQFAGVPFEDYVSDAIGLALSDAQSAEAPAPVKQRPKKINTRKPAAAPVVPKRQPREEAKPAASSRHAARVSPPRSPRPSVSPRVTEVSPRAPASPRAPISPRAPVSPRAASPRAAASPRSGSPRSGSNSPRPSIHHDVLSPSYKQPCLAKVVPRVDSDTRRRREERRNKPRDTATSDWKRNPVRVSGVYTRSVSPRPAGPAWDSRPDKPLAPSSPRYDRRSVSPRAIPRGVTPPRHRPTRLAAPVFVPPPGYGAPYWDGEMWQTSMVMAPQGPLPMFVGGYHGSPVLPPLAHSPRRPPARSPRPGGSPRPSGSPKKPVWR